MTTMTVNNTISETLEDYLEAIYTLSLNKPAVRITDIAMHLGLSKPSVNRAVNSLMRLGLVEHEPYGDIILTPHGTEKGRECYMKHQLVTKFFVQVLTLDEETAEKEACKIEHSLSAGTISKIENYLLNWQMCTS